MIVPETSHTTGMGLGVRINAANQGYWVQRYGTGWRMYRKVAGGQTSLGSAAGTAHTGQAVQVILEAEGDEIRFFVNSELLISATDSTYPTGSIGVYFDGTTGPVLDDFSGGSL